MDILDKIRKISAQECMSLKRLPYCMLVGHCATVFNKVGIPRINPIPEEYFDAVIDGINDEIYGYDIEPEFDTVEEYERYENAISDLKKCTYDVEHYTEDYYGYKTIKGPHSPYKDKTIPFLAYRK